MLYDPDHNPRPLRNRGRHAAYSLSSRGNIVTRYLPDDPEWPLTKLEEFENKQLAAGLLKQLRKMLIRLSKLQNPRNFSTHRLLRSGIEDEVIDTYPGQDVCLSDLILATGIWPVSDLYRLNMGFEKFVDIQWDPEPQGGESEDDELVILSAEFLDGQVWVYAQRGIPREAGSFGIDCSDVDATGEINYWLTFKSAAWGGDYSELRYAGWVSFNS